MYSIKSCYGNCAGLLAAHDGSLIQHASSQTIDAQAQQFEGDPVTLELLRLCVDFYQECTSTILPISSPVASKRCASAACATGNVCAMIGVTAFCAISSNMCC